LILSPHPDDPSGVAPFIEKMKSSLDPSISAERLIIGHRPAEAGGVATIFRLIADWLSFAGRVWRGRYDVIHLNPTLDSKSTLRDGVFLLILKLMRFRRVLVFFHGWRVNTERRIAGNVLFRTLFMWLFCSAPGILVLSEKFRRALIAMGCPCDRIEIITTMFDGGPLRQAQTELGCGHERRSILFLSRFIRAKGVYELLEAFARVGRGYPDVELVMAGEGEEEAGLKRAAVALGIAERVRFPGYLRGLEKARALLDARVFVLASYTEGLPNALLEALAAGNAVICTRVGGIPEVVDDPENGILLDEVTVDGIAAALERLLSDDANRAAIGERNAAKAWPLYEADVVTKRIEAAYARVAGGAGGS